MAKFTKGTPKPANSGRKRGVGNKRAKAHPDALAHLAKVMRGKMPNITEELRVRAASVLAQYQNPKPTAPRVETFITPIDYRKPQTVEAAREMVLTLGERLTKREISVEAHDALVGGIKVFLADRAAEQQRELDRLKEDLGMNVGRP
jgi:hypothetical protein